jgi:hypothetical protein
MRAAKKITRIPKQGTIATVEERISEFMSGKIRREDQREFAKAFKASVRLDAEESKLQDPDLTPSQKTQIEKRIRSLNNQITPAAKRAAIESYKLLVKAASEEIRGKGTPENINELIEKLGPTVRERTYGAGGTGTRGKKATRVILSKTLGLKGKPGHKLGQKNR